MILRDSWTFRTNFNPVQWKQRRWWGWELADDHQHDDVELWGPNFSNSEHIWSPAVGFYKVQWFFYRKMWLVWNDPDRGCETVSHISASNPRLRASMCIFTFSTYNNLPEPLIFILCSFYQLGLKDVHIRLNEMKIIQQNTKSNLSWNKKNLLSLSSLQST